VTTQLPLDLGHLPALGRADFLIAPCNEAAAAWLDRWPDWPASALALFGPAGSGKTHLAHLWRARSNAVFIDPRALAPERVPDLLAAARAAVVDEAERARAGGERREQPADQLEFVRRGHVPATRRLVARGRCGRARH